MVALTVEEAIARAFLDPAYVAAAYFDPDYWDIDVRRPAAGLCARRAAIGSGVPDRIELVHARHEDGRW